MGVTEGPARLNIKRPASVASFAFVVLAAAALRNAHRAVGPQTVAGLKLGPTDK